MHYFSLPVIQKMRKMKTTLLTEIVTDNLKSDTTEITITPKEVELKSEEILKKTENINNQLDEILKN